MNAKRVERIWRREGLKVPKRQPKRGRLWLNDGSSGAGVDHVGAALGVSERRACRVIGQHRSTQRKPSLNQHLRKAVSNLTLDAMILKEVVEGKF